MSKFALVIAVIALIGLAGCTAPGCNKPLFGATKGIDDNACKPCGKFELSWEQFKHDMSKNWFWQRPGAFDDPCGECK